MLEYPVVILAGGFGTRLSSVVQDVPKPMAPIGNKPFLYYILSYLKQQQAQKIILSVGYLSEKIINYFGNCFLGMDIEYVIEKEALGTGGAIKLAFEKIDDAAFVLNGDTFFDIDLQALKPKYADISIALKPMQNFDRYGTVTMDENNRILSFQEKEFCKLGNINGGIYFIRKSVFSQINTASKFSMEKDVFEQHANTLQINGVLFNNYFIDIGIPEDYFTAQTYFSDKHE